jgi:catechol 2,3-dioxygenase-like lactoylglutathione lyase family enzyme
MTNITSITVGLPSTDIQRSTAWYLKLFGTIPRLNPAPGVVEFQILDQIWLQVMDGSGQEPPGHVLRVGVDDLDAECALLRQRGVEVGSITELPISEGGITIALCYLDDPDGNKICFYQVKALP